MDFGEFTIVVLDEVDRMFDMGFRKDIGAILKQCKNRKQIMFLSATFPRRSCVWPNDSSVIRSVFRRSRKKILLWKLSIRVTSPYPPAVSSPSLDRLLKRDNPELALIFCRTKRGTERIGRRAPGEAL